jgi:hypothetical protein
MAIVLHNECGYAALNVTLLCLIHNGSTSFVLSFLLTFDGARKQSSFLLKLKNMALHKCICVHADRDRERFVFISKKVDR